MLSPRQEEATGYSIGGNKLDTERQTPHALTGVEPKTSGPVVGGTEMWVGLVKDI